MPAAIKQTDSPSERPGDSKKESSVGIREVINKSRYAVAGVAVAAIVTAGYFIISTVREGSTPGYAHKAYYSDDDGASYFEDSNKLIPPIDHHGHPAYKAYVFTADKGSTKWVGYLEGYTPEAQKKMIDLQADMDQRAKDPNSPPPPKDKDPALVIPVIQLKGLLVKRPDKPGQPPNKWVCPADGDIFLKTQKPVAPAGQNSDMTMIVLP